MKYRKPLGHGEHPLAHRQAGEDVVVQVRCCLHHAPGGARGADSPAFAGEGYKVVVPTVAAASAGKAMGKDAALKILGKRFAHEGLGGVVVALAVELTRADQL
jgi:metallophosphoesterase superfamily enzyme